MKKCSVFLAVAAMLVLLCGCQTYREYEFEQSLEQVTQVWIVTEEAGIEF